MDRKPVIAVAVSCVLLLGAGTAGLIASTSEASALAAPKEGPSAAVAPAGLVMGWEVEGLGRDAYVHSIRVDEHGAPEAFTIERSGWLGLGSSRVTIAADDLVYLATERRFVASAG